MKRYTLTIAILGAFCGLAFAGPEPLPSGKEVLQPAPIAPPPCFVGWYIGVHGGALLQFQDENQIVAESRVVNPGGNVLTFGMFDDKNGNGDVGPFGGVHLGRNYMWHWLVFGLEADADGSWWRRGIDAPTNHAGPINHGIDANAENQLTWFGTLRPRIGFTVWRLFPFVTGGLAVGGTDTDVDSDIHYRFPGRDGEDIFVHTHREESEHSVGWTAGGGLDFCLTEHFILTFTYLYMDLGRTRTGSGISHIANPNTGNGNPPFAIEFMGGRNTADLTYHTFRGGLSYRF